MKLDKTIKLNITLELNSTSLSSTVPNKYIAEAIQAGDGRQPLSGFIVLLAFL